MSIVTDFADLFSFAADGVSSAMDDWLNQRPTDPNLVPLWNIDYRRLGDAAAGLRSVAAHLYNLDARAVLDSVKDQINEISLETSKIKDSIVQIHKISSIIDVLTDFVTLGVSIATLVAAPNLASAAAVLGEAKALVTSIQNYQTAEAAARTGAAATVVAPAATM